MALHTELPIYRTGVRLLALAVAAQVQMPRTVKRMLGEKITGHCTEMVNLMALANATRGNQRAEYIRELLARQHATTVLLRVSHDLKLISHDVWGRSVQLLDGIGKQGGGWLKSSIAGFGVSRYHLCTSKEGGIGVPKDRRKSRAVQVCGFFHAPVTAGCVGASKDAPVLSRYANPAQSATLDWRQGRQVQNLLIGVCGYEQSTWKCEARWSRNVDLCALEVNDAALQQPASHELQALRRTGRHSVRALARLCLISYGYGRVSGQIHDAGPSAQRIGIRAWELPMGNTGRAKSQSFKQHFNHIQRRYSQPCGLGQIRKHDAERSRNAPSAWMDCGTRVDATTQASHRQVRPAHSANSTEIGNSYLGLVRQASHSHVDQADIAGVLRKRGHAVKGDLSKIYRKKNKC